MNMLTMSSPVGMPLAPPQSQLIPWNVQPGLPVADRPAPGGEATDKIAPKPCLTCRRRHVRCDKQLPRCHRCVRFGRVCPGYAPNTRGKSQNGSSKRPRLGSSASDGGVLTVPLTVKTEFGDLGKVDPDLEMHHSSTDLSTASMWSILDNQVMSADSPSNAFSVCSSMGDDEDSQWLSVLRNEETTPCRYFVSMVPFSPLIRNLFLLLASYLGPKASESNSPGDVELLRRKSEALEGFIRGIDDGDKSDVMVAATVLLIWVGFHDEELGAFFGSHLFALRELLRARGVPNQSMGDAALPWRPRPLSIFQEYFEEIYVVLGTLGTTLLPQKGDLTLLFPAPAVAAICGRAEKRSWVGCPGELLQVLAAVNKLSAGAPAKPASAMGATGPPTPPASDEWIATLFQRLAEFSPREWANQSDKHQQQQCTPANSCSPAPSPILEDMASTNDDRFHLASAYKGAIYIYACRALRIRSCPQLDGFVNEVVGHLERVSTESPRFGSTMWPAVIAGMESGSTWARESVRGLLQRHRATAGPQSLHLGRAEALLEKLWAESHGGLGLRSWLDFVYDFELDLIVI
ncbi:hypothetical protein MCOR23_011699 [Pyricularia oryzae]|nr:hypothetical protein MCOR26_011281 [Pyricularia oryzae]KAI6338480.1 hypothetical protein MCOR28_007952 [Pyricularia oryzae]KAI6384909.1 hypothetical protein MCOR23_011699 [Pyricularia oryzae]KAI6428150.1 hypothetical protein MCOR22_010533 [Pyricularia oryzae]